jgi:hypothetical protein
MRAREFISEDRNSTRKDGRLASTYDQANPGALTGHDIDRFYDMYRAGMLMAAGPDDIAHLDPASWINNQPYFGAYTDADRAKILAAFKALGIRPKTLIEPGSLEHEEVNKQSPVKGFRGYPR